MSSRSRAAAAVLTTLVVAPAMADERDDRIKRLEEETAELRKELKELKSDRASPGDAAAIRAAVDDYLAHSGSSGPRSSYAGPGGVRRPGGDITFGGYFSTRWLSAEQEGKNSFVDMRLVPQFHAQITERIAFDTEVEIEHGGISDEVDGEIVVEFAELSFRHSDAFKFKVGTLLVPFGWFNQNHDDPLNELSARPDVARYVVPSAFDLPGVGAEGMIEACEDLALTYDVVLNNGLEDEFSGSDGARDARTLFESDENHDKTVWGRMSLVPTVDWIDALTFGASGALGKVGEQSDPFRGYGVDATSKWGPWEFKGEYDRFGIDRGRAAPPPIDAAGNLGPVSGYHGWYGQLAYRFVDAWVRSLPFAEKDASVAVVVRRDDTDLNDRVHGGGSRDDERAWTIGVNYRPTTKTVVKVEFRHGSSGAEGDEGDERDAFVVEFATYF
jgi:hypothetical protein